MVDGITPSTSAEANLWQFPAGTVQDRTYRVMNDIKSENDQLLRVRVNVPLNWTKRDLRELEDQRVDAIKKADRAAGFLKAWAHGSLLVSGLYGAISISYGAFKISKGNAVRRFIAVGTALLANALLADQGNWETVASYLSFGNEKVKDNLEVYLPTIVCIASLVFGFYNLSLFGKLHKTWPLVDRVFFWVGVGVDTEKGISLVQKILAEGEVQRLDQEMKAKNQELTYYIGVRKPLYDTYNGINRSFREILKNFTKF